MSRKAKIWLIASAIFLVFVILVWFVASALHLKSPDIWVFRAGLWVLGAIAAGFVVWYLLRQLAPTAPGTRTDTTARASSQVTTSASTFSCSPRSCCSSSRSESERDEGSSRRALVIRRVVILCV